MNPFILYSICMNKRFFLLIVVVIMTIAYIDLVNSFKYFDTITSKFIKTESNDIQKKLIKTQK